MSKTSAQVSWQWSGFQDLRPEHLYEIVRLREVVFIVEQQCAYLDADGRDSAAWHLLGWHEENGARKLAAYARVFEPGIRYQEGSVGRVVTAPEMRRTGIGRLLMAEALRRLEGLAPGRPVRIAAQRYLESFYSSFGFKPASAPYEEDGIIHVDMVRE
ncbi:MAG: GNAT family N-acetyltransferase [Gemmatimonadota bacterium]|nr:GNAT family N-acetyltransferase [Gemmatimonadota bacterium]